MNQDHFKVVCLQMMGASQFRENTHGEEHLGSEYIVNARGSLVLMLDDGIYAPEKAGVIRTVKYNAPGAKMELWPISGDYSRVYDTLAFMIRRQILWHKKTCEILRTHKFMIEQVREAYVQYVELLDMPNPVIECYLYNGGPRLFEIRRTGVQFAHPERGTKTITRLADLPEGEMKDIVRIMRDGSRHGIEIFRTPGAYFISDGTERHPKRGHVYSPKFPCGEPA